MSKKNKNNSTPAPKPDAAPAASGGSLPMFFRKPRPLDVNRHKQASVLGGSDFSFARDTNSIVLNAIEFLEASRYYPIVFTSDEKPLPTAIVGLERANYFVSEDGAWNEGSYIPAYVRQYPFLFLDRAQEKKFYLCIDEESPHFSLETKKGAHPLYTGDGKPSPLTQHALQFCTAFYNHHRITRNFCDDLVKHNLLVPYRSEAKLAGSRTIKLSGFKMIDEKALSRLSDEDFLEFRRKGWLPFIYFAMASSSHWKRLADMAGQQEKSAKSA